jgi:transposase
MFIATIPNRNSKPAILLREGYREDGKVKTRTLANLSHLPAETIEAFRAVLKGAPIGDDPEASETLPHGHVLAVLGMIRQLELDTILYCKRNRMRDLSLALIAGHIIDPCSKLSLAQSMARGAEHNSLGEVLALGELGLLAENATKFEQKQSQSKRAVGELYAAMDWLLERQEKIENALAQKHLNSGCTVLYDLSSSYFEGRTCPLAHHGHSRDHRGDRPQINYGLLCNEEGVPVAIEVVEGNVGDATTIPAQVAKLKNRFHLERIVVVGDRGMITEARIREDISRVGYDWISALRHATILPLVKEKIIVPGKFDEQGIAEITHPEFPGERLIACFNPLRAEEAKRKREKLLELTEIELQKVSAACNRKKDPLEGKGPIGLKAGAALSKFKVGKYFKLHIGEHSLRISRCRELIDRDAAMDGIYVIRTSLPGDAMKADKAVLTYKGLSKVERAFRTLKSIDLQVRPIYHYQPNRVRAHMFLCMLAYYVEFHLRQAWAELLYVDEEGSERKTVVSPSKPSDSAKAKKQEGVTKEGLPLQTFSGLLKSLGTLSLLKINLIKDGPVYTRTTKPTPLQARAFKLINVQIAP